MQPAVSNDNKTQNYAILGNGLDTDSRYGNLSWLAKRMFAELLHPSPISEDAKRHETAVGQMGQANFVMCFDPCKTLRTFVEVTTVGADKEGAYSSCDVIPEADVRSRSAVEAEEDPLSILHKFHNENKSRAW